MPGQVSIKIGGPPSLSSNQLVISILYTMTRDDGHLPGMAFNRVPDSFLVMYSLPRMKKLRSLVSMKNVRLLLGESLTWLGTPGLLGRDLNSIFKQIIAVWYGNAFSAYHSFLRYITSKYLAPPPSNLIIFNSLTMSSQFCGVACYETGCQVVCIFLYG